MKRMAQEGMAKVEDLPSTVNINETKRSLGLTLKADLKRAMDIIGDAMEDLLSGLETIFMDSLNANGSEMGTLDTLMARKIVMRFLKSLSSSEEGLLRMIEDIRIWICLAPMVKKDKLNALLVALKNLKAPVTAGMVLGLIKEGIPTRLDEFIEYMVESTERDLGKMDLITISPWQALSVKSSIEISDTTLVNPVPVHTSSAMDVQQPQPKKDTSTRVTLDRLKMRFRDASSALGKQ